MNKMIIAITFLFSSGILFAEELKWANPAEPLFVSKDPVLHRNKQVVYHIVRDLLEANQWEIANKYISDKEYIQHNPNAKSGLDSVVYFFTKVLKVKPSPIPERITKFKIIAVTAEDDLVTVLYVRDVPSNDPKVPSYQTTWYDTWRIKDGKAVEHWDPALMAEAPKL